MEPLKAREFAAPRAASCPALFTFAQRAFCPAAILARASGLTVRFFALFAAGLALVAFLGAGTAEELRTALFFKAFFDFAQPSSSEIYVSVFALNRRVRRHLD